MEQLAARYPDDAEALILYTLALLMAAPPDDLTFAKQRHAAVILEALSERLPDHPGVAHYLIHAYDTPTDAPKGLTAAQHYAQIAPDSAHAVHMPSHIFTRVGAWTDSIQSNARSARVAHTENMSNDELHAMDYLVYAYLQTGQTRAARVVQDDARSVADHLDATHLGGPFAAAAIDARLALESGDWSAATALSIRLSQFCYVPAMTHYARALGFARSGNPAAAGPELESLAALAGKLYAANDSYWAGQVEIQLVASAAWVAFASGRHEEGLAQMRAAAEMESATNKNVVTPGPLLPARELLAEMLLDVDRPTEAHTQFAKVLEVEPDRFRSLFGAGRAAELAGDLVGAKLRYARLLQIAANADTDRLELQQARAFLAANCPCVRQ